MAQNNVEQLKKLLKFIEALAGEPGNEWFENELRNRFCPKIHTQSNSSMQIDHIEEYLGLDFKLDSIDAIIDYSYIKNEYIKFQLISDNREMLRFRYGTRFHKIDFREFCRYVVLQVEMLLNYFYSTKENNDIVLIKKHINNHNAKIEMMDNWEKLEEISLTVKLWSFSNEFRGNFFNLRNAIKIRNMQSHRNDNDEFSIESYSKKLISSGFSLNKNGSIKKTNTIPQEKYNEISNSPDYKTYTLAIWLKDVPFNDVIRQLKELSSQVKQNI